MPRRSKDDVSVVFIHGLWNHQPFGFWEKFSEGQGWNVHIWQGGELAVEGLSRDSVCDQLESIQRLLNGLPMNQDKVLVGHSLGAFLASRLENIRSDIAGVVQVAPAGNWLASNLLGRQIWRAGKYLPQMARGQQMVPGEADAWAALHGSSLCRPNRQEVLTAEPSRLVLRAATWLGPIREAKAKTLIVSGENDRLINRAVPHLLARKHRAKLVSVPFCHMVPTCDTGVAIAAILDWIGAEVVNG